MPISRGNLQRRVEEAIVVEARRDKAREDRGVEQTIATPAREAAGAVRGDSQSQASDSRSREEDDCAGAGSEGWRTGRPSVEKPFIVGRVGKLRPIGNRLLAASLPYTRMVATKGGMELEQ